ncbi:MAG: hypothetical protein K1X74_00795 [Pirellulales bacterium]|nr:hypothetical protein [Pirellulales bacterium]
MRWMDCTLERPAANVALDEALLMAAEAAPAPVEYLRLWESATPMVVVGRSSRVADEVDEAACLAAGTPIVRRASGGAAIVAGRGCLMYAVVLSTALRPEVQAVAEAHRLVLGRLVEALARRWPGVARRGTSDLAWHERKFSGNSLRVRRTHVLYHGTLLYGFDLASVERWLRMPPRQPTYRDGRAHGAFLTNLPAQRDELCAALVEASGAEPLPGELPLELTERLVAERYSQEAWNNRL